MIEKLVIVVIAIFMFALAFIFLTVSNDAIYGPGGLDEELNEQAQKDLSNMYKQKWNEQRSSTRWTFGLTAFLICAVIFLIMVIVVFHKRRQVER